MNIRVEGLQKSYGKGELRASVLEDIAFGIDPGEFVAIMGTSGSGKTTLLNIMGGLDRDYRGHVSVGSNELAKLDEKQLARLRNAKFGFVFQQFHLLDHLTSLENVAIPRFFDADAAEEQKALGRARELLTTVGLGEKLDSYPSELSGGQKQRVAIARALFNRPEVIFCDEPTGSLDRSTGLQILELFQKLNRDEGITLIMVTHEEHIARLATRIIRLEDGVLVSDEPNTPKKPAATTLEVDGALPQSQTSEEE
jgi:ABC-type lipoprotein export system ATPase subunit